MIKIDDLNEAIAECQGERNPNANTCIKLAAYYTIKKELSNNNDSSMQDIGYSFQPPQIENAQQTVDIDSESEFAKAANGKQAERVWRIVDELMATLYVVNRPIYKAVLRELTE